MAISSFIKVPLVSIENVIKLESFLISSILLILGTALFTFGADLSMVVIGEKIGNKLVKSKKVWIILIASFIGTLATIICAKGKISYYIWAFIQTVMFLILNVVLRLWVESAEQLYYLITMIIGVFIWKKNIDCGYRLLDD